MSDANTSIEAAWKAIERRAYAASVGAPWELSVADSVVLLEDRERLQVDLANLRALCRRVAEHMSAEHHIGLKDPATNAALIAELEHAGWDKGGKER